MAITHFTLQVIGRSDGRSAVAAAAYRHCARMENVHEDRVSDFSRKPDMVHDEFVLPEGAPAWAVGMVKGLTAAQSAEAFWNQVEAFEKRKDAQLAKEFIIALPVELTTEQNIELVRDFIGSQLSPRGFVADWVYHDAAGNPHAHLMTNLRPLAEDGFGDKKVPVLDGDGNLIRGKQGRILYRRWAGEKSDLLAMREAWYAAQNKHLELNGHSVRVDGRSYAERGIDLEPTPHIGVASKAIQRAAEEQGEEVSLERLDAHAEVRQENAARIGADPQIVIDAVSRERSVFDERDLARIVHRYVDDPAEFQGLMARIMTSPALVMIEDQAIDFSTGEVLPARYALREMIAIEAQMGAQAEALVRGGRFGVSARVRDRVLSSQDRLSDEQRMAVERVTGRERMAMVVGRAGAGKTTMLNAARQVWETNGYRVVGGALAGKAAEGLQNEAGIDSRTLASWELQWSNGRLELDDKTVFVMDEAGMVASRQMANFVSAVSQAGAKLVLVGDADQLQPIEAGGAFASLARITGYAELETIYRQSEDWMRQASLDLARGDVGAALAAYREHDHLIAAETQSEAIDTLIADWRADYDPSRSDLILAYTRRDVRTLNERARAALIEDGRLSEGHGFRTHDGDRQFAAGDHVVFLKNEGSLGVMNGMIGRVVEAGEGYLRVEVGDDNRVVEIEQRFYAHVDQGYATTVHKSQGATVDRVKVLASSLFDRHLSYVALTRHRHTVDLYAAAEEFARFSRVDHTAGVTGTLIDVGKAKVNEERDVRPSPYADVQDAAGAVHRLWGVSLPDALTGADVSLGDTVTLRKDGTETVTVKVPVVDEQSGKKRFEERAVERNVWSATLIEHGDLNAGRADVAALFAKAGRIDHEAGLTGELVALDQAKFREGANVKPTPYADLKVSDGKVHRLWGVSLPAAIGNAGVSLGDTVALRKDGTETVTVKVPVIDEPTGKKRFEERAVERNIWSAEKVVSDIEQAQDVQAEASEGKVQPALFHGLVTAMARSAAKGTTLDYAGSALYDQALRYANNRGLFGVRVVKALAKSHARWIKEQRERLANAATKLSSVAEWIGLRRPVQASGQDEVVAVPLLRGVTTFAQTIDQAVERKMQGDASLTIIWEDIRRRMNTIYENPEQAMKAMNLPGALQGDAASATADQTRLYSQLAAEPETFGPLRGRTGFWASKTAKSERERATRSTAALSRDMADYVRVHRENAARHREQLGKHRQRQQMDIPAISSAAERVLDRIRDGIDRNDIQSAMGFALADKMVKAEVDALNATLKAKFGQRAFLASATPGAKAFDKVAAKVAPSDHAKLAAAWPLFHAAQEMAVHEAVQAQIQVQKQQQARDQGITR